MADSIEGFLNRAKCKAEIIKVVADAPEGSYVLVAIVPQGEPGAGKLVVHTPATTTFALYGFYALIEMIVGSAKDDVMGAIATGGQELDGTEA
jgi:hypothetical protein